MTQETAAHIEPDGQCLSRADVIVKGALATGAIYGFEMIAPFVRRALAASGASDVDVLNLVLKLEYVEVALYDAAKQRLKPTGELKRLIDTLAEDEHRHVGKLTSEIERLGGKPAERISYASSYRDADGFLGLAISIEEAVVAAYNGAIPTIESKELQAMAASIVQVEGRHAAAVRIQRKEEPSPEAFDLAHNEVEALNSVERFTGPAIYEHAFQGYE